MGGLPPSQSQGPTSSSLGTRTADKPVAEAVQAGEAAVVAGDPRLCRDRLRGGRRPSELDTVWGPRWVCGKEGRLRGAQRCARGRAVTTRLGTATEGDTARVTTGPRAALPQHPGSPGPVWTKLLHFSKVEQPWKVRDSSRGAGAGLLGRGQAGFRAPLFSLAEPFVLMERRC